jgi:hypothetical protein
MRPSIDRPQAISCGGDCRGRCVLTCIQFSHPTRLPGFGSRKAPNLMISDVINSCECQSYSALFVLLVPSHHHHRLSLLEPRFSFPLPPSARDFFFLGLLHTHSNLFTTMVASVVTASSRLENAGAGVMYFIFGLVVQTFFFGVFFFR